MSSRPYLIFEGDTVASLARTSRHQHGKGKPRAPTDMRELLRTGRWSNGDPLSSSDAYEIARHLKPKQPRAKAIRVHA